MSLTQFKIGTRLGIGFAVVLGLLVAVLLVGLYSMAQLSNRTHDIVTDKNVKMAAANTMSDNVRNITLAITSVVVAPTEALVQAELAKIGDARKKYGAAKEILQKKITTDKETALMAELDAALKAGAPLNNKVIELRNAGQTEEAITFLTQQAAPSLKRVLGALDSLVALEGELAAQAAGDAEALSSSARASMILLGSLAVLLGAFVAWIITRSITRPINAAVGVAETVASGDLSSHIVQAEPCARRASGHRAPRRQAGARACRAQGRRGHPATPQQCRCRQRMGRVLTNSNIRCTRKPGRKLLPGFFSPIRRTFFAAKRAQ
eukprot:gene18461-22092_t